MLRKVATVEWHQDHVRSPLARGLVLGGPQDGGDHVGAVDVVGVGDAQVLALWPVLYLVKHVIRGSIACIHFGEL
jgi:hypothetical protein